MPIIALLAAILAALVWTAERLAFACLLYVTGRWLWQASVGIRGWLARHIDGLLAQLKTVHLAALYGSPCARSCVL
jgi:hypothetical protein